jgi:hypothetical protein
MHFDLITWPGYLCYAGDMGTFVFSRLRDMFEFFRTDADSPHLKSKGLQLGINPSYWAQKLEATDKHGGVKEFSEEKFNAAIKHRFLEWIKWKRHDTSKEERRELWEAIESEVLCADGDGGGYRKQVAAHDFSHQVNQSNIFDFSDFFETNVEAYTFHYMWCCYALAWGIQKFDAATTKEPSNV